MKDTNAKLLDEKLHSNSSKERVVKGESAKQDNTLVVQLQHEIKLQEVKVKELEEEVETLRSKGKSDSKRSLDRSLDGRNAFMNGLPGEGKHIPTPPPSRDKKKDSYSRRVYSAR